MKRFLLSIGMSLCFLGTSFGQVSLNSDQFTGENNKGYDGSSTLDVSGVDWTITGDASGVTASTDYFAVKSEQMEIRDIDGTLTWESESFSISNYSSLKLSIDLGANGDFESSGDIFTIGYILDGGSKTALLTGVVDEAAAGDPMTINSTELSSTLATFTADISGTGSNLKIYVEANNNAGTEYYYFDNVVVEGMPDATISGSAGWRLLSLPKTGGTVQDVSDDTPVQGVTGGDDASSTTNFIIYDNDAEFEKPTNVSTTWGDGYGFGLFFYNNTTNGSSTLPVTLDASGSEPSSDVAVTLNPASSGYTLVGNPFASNFNTNNLVSSVAAIQNTIHFWNGSSYVGQDRTASSGFIIAPWQGFWVQKDATANAATLTFPTSGKTTSSTSGTYFKTMEQRGDINFSLNSETTIDEDLRLAFRAGASFEYDIDDAGKLTPLLSAYAIMAFESNDILKSVESLPYNLEEEVTLSLQPQMVGVSGDFTFAWNGLETIPGEWELILHDYETGANINMRDESEYMFFQAAHVKVSSNPLSLLNGPAAVTMKAKAEGNRFGITIRPTSVSNESEETPTLFALEQNYPNPFNPSTTISYSVQEAGAVNISVYNLMGQKVATLVDEMKAAGQYNVRWNAAGAASGMYYYRLEAGGQSITRKMTLIK
jgi:hypothetical protein